MKFSEFPYHNPDISTVKKTFEDLFEKFSTSASFNEQHEIFLEINEGFKSYSTMWNLAPIRFSLDMNSDTAKTNREHFDNLEPDYSAIEKKFDGLFLASEFLPEYEKKYGKNLKKTMEIDFKLYSDEVSEEIKEENALETAYSELRGKGMAEFDGKEITFSDLDAFLDSTDRETRKKAYTAFWKFFEENNGAFCKLLDDIIKVRTRIAKKLGFKNFIELAYARLDKEYLPEDAALFRSHIKKYVVPLGVKLLKRQSERIGIEKLKHYDISLKFKTGNALPSGNPEWIVEQAKRCMRNYHLKPVSLLIS